MAKVVLTVGVGGLNWWATSRTTGRNRPVCRERGRFTGGEKEERKMMMVMLTMKRCVGHELIHCKRWGDVRGRFRLSFLTKSYPSTALH